MPPTDEESRKQREAVKKNVKAIKRNFKNACSRDNIWTGMMVIVTFCSLGWIGHLLFLRMEESQPAVMEPGIGARVMAPEQVVKGIRLRGDVPENYVVPWLKGDPIEFKSDWDVPLPEKPLERKDYKMRKLNDGPGNYPGWSFARQHGIYGARPDGAAHSWETDLQVPLTRDFPDFRRKECQNAPFYTKDVVQNMPAASVIFIFSNEPWETMMRSVHSVLNNTPPHLLHEIIMVDDGSTFGEYAPDGNNQLVDYIECCLPPKVKFTRTNSRAGITRARVSGIKAATSDIFVILDSHIETEPGWIEPLIYKIQEDPLTFTMPMIDGIKKDKDFTPNGGGVGCSLGLIWKIMEHSLTPNHESPEHRQLKEPWGYVSSPSMSGGLFAGNRQVFLDLGAYDLDMTGWGAENVEFGMRLWQCGTKLMCSQCSRVAHIFGRGQFYKQKGGEAVQNRLRTAGVWMDEFAVLPWIFNRKPSWDKMGDISRMMTLRKNLQCRNFEWFLKEVWPESPITEIAHVQYFGVLKHVETDQCVTSANRGTHIQTGADRCKELIYYAKGQHIGSGSDDEAYLEDLKFDWPREFNADQQFELTLLETNAKENKIMIKNKKNGQCLTKIDEQQAVTYGPCDEKDSWQHWVWDRFNIEDWKGKWFNVDDY